MCVHFAVPVAQVQISACMTVCEVLHLILINYVIIMLAVGLSRAGSGALVVINSDYSKLQAVVVMMVVVVCVWGGGGEGGVLC